MPRWDTHFRLRKSTKTLFPSVFRIFITDKEFSGFRTFFGWHQEDVILSKKQYMQLGTNDISRITPWPKSDNPFEITAKIFISFVFSDLNDMENVQKFSFHLILKF